MLQQQLVSVVTLLVLDLLWVSFFMFKKYKEMVPKIQGGAPASFNMIAAVVAYFLMVVGLLFFCVREEDSVWEAAARGAVFGLVVYGVYDMTVAGILKDFEIWPLGVIDIAWGTFVFAFASACGSLLK